MLRVHGFIPWDLEFESPVHLVLAGPSRRLNPSLVHLRELFEFLQGLGFKAVQHQVALRLILGSGGQSSWLKDPAHTFRLPSSCHPKSYSIYLSGTIGFRQDKAEVGQVRRRSGQACC